MRLPNGYGSVYKLSGKRRKPFAPIITTGWTDEGKAIRKYLGYFDTRSAALKALADYNEKPYNIQDTNISLLKFWEKYAAYCASRDKPVPSNYKAAFKRMEPYYNIPFREVTVSPACAGVIPAGNENQTINRCKPRMRGGDPKAFFLLKKVSE